MTINIGNTGMVINDNAMEKMRELQCVRSKHNEANSLWVASCLAEGTDRAGELQHRAEAASQEVTELSASYYDKYPNCLSRKTVPWEK